MPKAFRWSNFATPSPRNRLRWAREHTLLTVEDWRRVLFSDECRFCLYSDDRRKLIYRREHQRLAAKKSPRIRPIFFQQVWWFGVKIQVTRKPVPFLYRATWTLFATLPRSFNRGPTVVLPFLQQNSDVMTHQQDIAPAHRSAQVTSFIRWTNLHVLPWPAMSPDFNPIDQVWDAMKRRIRRENPENLVSLARSVISAWESLPDSRIRNVVESMPRRTQQCIRKRGGHTGYWWTQKYSFKTCFYSKIFSLVAFLLQASVLSPDRFGGKKFGGEGLNWKGVNLIFELREREYKRRNFSEIER